MAHNEGMKDFSNGHNVLGKISHAAMAVLVYGMFFVVLMLVSGGIIKLDGLVLPAIALFLVISLIQYIVKGTSKSPRWLVIGSFLTALATAGVMTIILH